jgi:hypothetical protein
MEAWLKQLEGNTSALLTPQIDTDSVGGFNREVHRV